MKKCKLAFESSCTQNPLARYLKQAGKNYDIDIECYFGPYNAYHQDVMNSASELYSFDPDILIISLRLEDVSSQLAYMYDPDKNSDYKEMAVQLIDQIRNLIDTFRKKSRGKVLVHNFYLTAGRSMGVYDSQTRDGQKFIIQSLNASLLDMIKSYKDVYVFDAEDVVADAGRRSWQDNRMWAVAKMPLSSKSLEALAREYVRYLYPLLGMTKKCLVLDLDNTLWAGVVGEDGFNGIRMDSDYPGAGYREFQRAILELYHRGIILAVSSKNNYDDAIQVIRDHPDMLLRESHFTVLKINWDNKADNVRKIAEDLNIGLDSLVFIDDNPAERDIIRQMVPEVMVPDLPDDPLEYGRFLLDLPVFENLSITAEDRERGKMYAAQIKRAELQNSAASMDDFLRSLSMRLVIGQADEYSIPRIAQLTQKTNQFNLTTRRYSEEDIKSFVESGNYLVACVQLIDRFGDNGITGVCIVKKGQDEWEIDTLLLSCRIMFRRVEDALLAHIVSLALADGAKRITGEYIQTKKNMPVADLYEKMKFDLVRPSGPGSKWCLDLTKTRPHFPDCFQIEYHG